MIIWVWYLLKNIVVSEELCYTVFSRYHIHFLLVWWIRFWEKTTNIRNNKVTYKKI